MAVRLSILFLSPKSSSRLIFIVNILFHSCLQFGWTHVTLLIVVTQSHLIMQNIFEGLIW